MKLEERLAELNIDLPPAVQANTPFGLGVVVENVVHLSGKTPLVEGKTKYPGIVGREVTMEQAQEAAEICVLNLLASLKHVVGDLNKVKRVIKMHGYVASGPDYTDQAKVINAASNLLVKIFGEDDKHARVALGVASLPGGAPVEIEMLVELKK